jgi:hypothetical protein
MSDSTLPKDHYSTRLRELQANPSAIEKTTLVDLVDILGNAESWIVKTIRVDGHDTVFLQRNNAEGGARWVLPAEVMMTIARQRDGVVDVANKRRAHTAAATRRAKLAPVAGRKE